jgi:hypothetical protein
MNDTGKYWREHPEEQRAYNHAYYHAHRAEILKQKAEYRAKHSERIRAEKRRDHLRREYGIAPEVYDRMAKEQDSLCYICKKPQTHYQNKRPVRLYVDHCHSSGIVRRLLCNNCNAMLGYAQDSPAILRQAAKYIEELSVETSTPNTCLEGEDTVRAA